MNKRFTVEIDEQGRVGLTPDLMSALQLTAGATLTIELKEGRIVLEPLPKEPELLEKDGLLVVRPRITGSIDNRVQKDREARIAHLNEALDESVV